MAKRASKLGTSVLDLDIDDSKFHSKLSGAYKSAQSFTDKTGTSLVKAGKAMTGVGESMTRNITLPIVAAGGVVTKFGLDFDTTMSEVVALTSVTSEQIGGIREELIKLGPEVGKSPQELAEAFYFVASAGFEGAEALDVTKNAAKAAAAGLGDTATVAKVVGTAINAYGRDNITAAEATDTLVAAIGEGSAEAPEFAGALGNVIGSAAQIGASFPDVTAAIAAMTNVGIGAEEAVTSLNQVFVSLFKPTAEAEEALDGLGLSAAGLRQMIAEKGLLPTLQLLSEKFDGNAEATAQVFGNVRALRGVLALTGGDAEKTAGIFERMGNTVGATGKAFDTVAESDAFKFRQSMAKLEATAISIGQDVLPMVVEVLGEIADKAEDVSEWWGSLDDDTKKLIIQFAAWLAVIGPVLIAVGKLTTGVGSLFKAVTFLAGANGLPKLVKSLSLAKLGFIGLAAAAAASAFEIRQHFVDTINHMVLDVLEQLGRKSGHTAAEVHADIQKISDALGVDVPEAAKRMAEEMARNGEDYDAAVQKMLRESQLAAAGIDSAWGAAADSVDGNISGFDRGAATMNATVSGFASGTKQTTKATTSAITQMTDEQKKAAEDAHKAVLDEITQLFKDLTSVLTNREDFDKEWQDFLDELEHPFTATQRRMAIEAQLGSKKLQEGLKSKDPQIKADAIAKVNDLIGQYNLIAPGALAAGELVNPKMASGINSNVHLAQTAAQQTAEKAGLELDQHDSWESAGAGNIDAYITGQQAHDEQVKHAAVQTAINGARAAANQKPSFRGAGFTAAGGFNDGFEDQEPNARAAGQGLAGAAKDGTHVNLYPDGWNTAGGWLSGMIARLGGVTARQQVAQAARLATLDLMGHSPPKTGPLRFIDKEGFNVGSAWTDNFVDALRAMNLSGPMAMIRAALARVGTPGLNALGPMVPLGNAARAAGNGAMPASITNQWILNVNGLPKTFDNNRDMLRELDAMSQFGGNG